MDLLLVCADITTQSVDAIVNAANSGLGGGGGVDGAIHRAGGPDILAQCRALRATPAYRNGLPTGQAVATSAGRLPAKWVIHTVGPIFDKRTDQRELLRACYRNSLAVADDLGADSVGFPLISAGAYGWPRADAVGQALGALCGADTRVKTVLLVLFDAATLTLAQSLLAG